MHNLYRCVVWTEKFYLHWIWIFVGNGAWDWNYGKYFHVSKLALNTKISPSMFGARKNLAYYNTHWHEYDHSHLDTWITYEHVEDVGMLKTSMVDCHNTWHKTWGCNTKNGNMVTRCPASHEECMVKAFVSLRNSQLAESQQWAIAINVRQVPHWDQSWPLRFMRVIAATVRSALMCLLTWYDNIVLFSF